MDKKAMLKYLPMFNYIALVLAILDAQRKLAAKELKKYLKVLLAVCGCAFVFWPVMSIVSRIPNEAVFMLGSAAVVYLLPLTATIAAEKLTARYTESN